jgi:hypothetical protein
VIRPLLHLATPQQLLSLFFVSLLRFGLKFYIVIDAPKLSDKERLLAGIANSRTP